MISSTFQMMKRKKTVVVRLRQITRTPDSKWMKRKRRKTLVVGDYDDWKQLIDFPMRKEEKERMMMR